MLLEGRADAAGARARSPGFDVHAAVASQVLGVPLEAVDADMRSTAKMINFGIVYGITGFGLARRLGGDVGVREAEQIIQDYKARFPRIDEFLEACMAQAKAQGWVATILGRRRRIPRHQGQNEGR